jgi:hypothetical protein
VAVRPHLRVDEPVGLVEQRNVGRAHLEPPGRRVLRDEARDLLVGEQISGERLQPLAVLEQLGEQPVAATRGHSRFARPLVLGRLAHRRADLLVRDHRARPGLVGRPRRRSGRERLAEAQARRVVRARALARGVLHLAHLRRGDHDLPAVEAHGDVLRRRRDAAPQQALEQDRHPPAALERRELAALGDLAVRARDERVDLALLDALLAERRQHLADVADERAVRADDQHALARERRVRVQQPRGAGAARPPSSPSRGRPE